LWTKTEQQSMQLHKNWEIRAQKEPFTEFCDHFFELNTLYNHLPIYLHLKQTKRTRPTDNWIHNKSCTRIIAQTPYHEMPVHQ